MSEFTRKLKSFAADRPALWNTVKKAQEWKYAFDYQTYYGRFSTSKASTTEINLEFCSNCNLRCSFCALDHDKPKTYMSLDVLDRLFTQLLEDERFSQVRTINLHNGGETLMHPDRVEMFKRIERFKAIFAEMGREFPTVILLTNGMLLRPKLAEEIISLKVLDEIGFSLDGGSPTAFEELRVNAKWEKFAENVRAVVEIKNRVDPLMKTFGISIIPKPNPLNNTWMEKDFKAITELLDSVEYRRLHDWGGQIDIGEEKIVNKKGCDMLMRQMVVLPNGDVTVCCNDLNSKGVVGNILKDDLYSIYKGEPRMHYVTLLKEGRKDELDLCRDCVSF